MILRKFTTLITVFCLKAILVAISQTTAYDNYPENVVDLTKAIVSGYGGAKVDYDDLSGYFISLVLILTKNHFSLYF